MTNLQTHRLNHRGNSLAKDPIDHWIAGPESDEWQSGKLSYLVSQQIQGEVPVPEPLIGQDWTRTCLTRVRNLRDVLRKSWVGLKTESRHITDILLATCIARENAVMIGPPGGAKTDIAVRMFELLGLEEPGVPANLTVSMPDNLDDAWKVWQARADLARERQTFFRGLLTRFTQPDELFGPWEISLLRQGVLARVNFGMMTGPGIRAAFTDEIFKASANLLNTLLTVGLERKYFQWNAWMPADLVFMVAASNEMPDAFSGYSSGGEDFRSQYALIDRFCVRLPVPVASGGTQDDPTMTDLAQAFVMAWRREAAKFSYGHAYGDRPAAMSASPVHAPPRPPHMPCINDLLLLGRACMQHETALGENWTKTTGQRVPPLFREDRLKQFRTAFLNIASSLQAEGTDIESGRITWTISPRKLKQLYKIALVHAVICDDEFIENPRQQVVAGPGESELRVFDFIWDSPAAEGQLMDQTSNLVGLYY